MICQADHASVRILVLLSKAINLITYKVNHRWKRRVQA